jgi:hypothetical protein
MLREFLQSAAKQMKVEGKRIYMRGRRLSRQAQTYVNIIRKDPCVFCGCACEVHPRTIDHIRPIRPQGKKVKSKVNEKNKWDNFAPACQTCNGEKANLSLLHFLIKRSHDRP